jgi:hypothetical protein
MPPKSTFNFPKPLPEKAITDATINAYKSKLNTIAKQVKYKKKTFVEREFPDGKKRKIKIMVEEPVDTIELLRDNPEPVIEFIKTQGVEGKKWDTPNHHKRVYCCAIFYILELTKESPPNKYYDYFQTIKTE